MRGCSPEWPRMSIRSRATRAAASAPSTTQAELLGFLKHKDPGVRYWGATGFLANAVTPDATATETLTEPPPSAPAHSRRR